MRETKNLEYKEDMSNTFLKTVSAYANYGSGDILFGVADDGTIKGVDAPEQFCLDIENRINNSIDPAPDYTLSIDQKTSVITLHVQEGMHKPYLYKAKAYKRNDSSVVAVDRLELTRLILEGQNSSFEELTAKTQNLSFAVLEEKLIATLNIAEVTTDTLKTLELYTEETGFNNAGELLADTNSFYGVDIVRFGETISVIHDRETCEHISILKQYDCCLDMYRKYYQYEQIQGSVREVVSTIPEAAFREAIANAIVHRTWDMQTNINVAMFPDSIEITSPGALPKGVSVEDYKSGGISILRNRIIGSVFYRLHLIEKFGTGIRRIKEAYEGSVVKPIFNVTDSNIKITLPVMRKKAELSPDENRVYELLENRDLASSQIVEATGFGKTKTVAILNRLIKNGYIVVYGAGRGRVYSRAFLFPQNIEEGDK